MGKVGVGQLAGWRWRGGEQGHLIVERRDTRSGDRHVLGCSWVDVGLVLGRTAVGKHCGKLFLVWVQMGRDRLGLSCVYVLRWALDFEAVCILAGRRTSGYQSA